MRLSGLKKITALFMAAAICFSGTAFADTVKLADRPFGTTTSNGTASSATTPGSSISQGSTTGPGGTTSSDTTTPGSSSSSSGSSVNVGPGQSGSSTSGPGSSTSATTGSTSSPAADTTTNANTITIDDKITKPSIYSEAAVLYDATANQVFFEKNAYQAMYPASTTKIMTALLAAEKLSESDTLTFASTAVNGLESGATTVQMTTGDTMTVKDALHALLLKSACEVANGLAEKVSGSQSAFAELMNKRASELGAKNTNFRNASGLNDQSHYTCAYDLALIAKAAFSNSLLKTVFATKSYTLPASKNRGRLELANSNKMLYSGNSEYFAGILGGKTGYTSKAGNTLVEVAEVNGHMLIAVALKSTGQQYTDCKALLNYGKQVLANAQGTSVTASEGKWVETSSGWMYKKSDGTYVKSDWMDIGENEYYFDSNGIMATGWKQFTNGAWYYLDPNTGAMVHDKWVSTDGVKYYYLQSNGVMATNTVINGTYRVDANGVYVEKVA